MRLTKRKSIARRFQMTIIAILFSLFIGSSGTTITIQAPASQVVYASSTEEVVETPADIAVRMIPHKYQETENRIRYLYSYAEERGVDAEPIAKTIWCESGWKCVQSTIVKNGVQEQSYCLAQIHAPSHPELSMEQLNDPYFNLEYIVDHYEIDTWYGYDRDIDECTNGVSEYW